MSPNCPLAIYYRTSGTVAAFVRQTGGFVLFDWSRGLTPDRKIFRLENGPFPKSVTPRRQVGTQTIDCFMS